MLLKLSISFTCPLGVLIEARSNNVKKLFFRFVFQSQFFNPVAQRIRRHMKELRRFCF
jgi:hypothetical protein